MTQSKKDLLLARLSLFGQEHLLAFWDALDSEARESLAGQIESIDLDRIRRLYEARDHRADVRALLARAEPPSAVRLNAASNPFPADAARRRGAEALAAGRIGAVLVAGGQGTRLGFDRPKGLLPIGPVSHKTLFQLLIEKVVAAARRWGARIPLYLMTSPATHDETAEYLAAHERFGLAEDDLILFCQGTMPAVDAETGRVLLESPGRIATSPDGHGGMVSALARAGALNDIHRRGIEHLFYFQVDNPLVDVCGPEFIGHHLLAGAEFSTQVVAKREPLERTGNVVQVDGRLMLIEYSELPEEDANRRNPDGSLVFWAGSTAVHVLAAALLDRLANAAEGLPFHAARKIAACIDPAGRPVEPDRPNAVKFERFIFDALPLARKAIAVETDRARTFAPVKNAAGACDSTPEAARSRMSALAREWLRQAGAVVPDDATVEISPLFALDAEELASKVAPGTRVENGTYFGGA